MFIGRGYYLDSLMALWRKPSSSMVVVSGRRRIGKSTLVEEFASRSKCRFIEIEGLAPDGKMTNQKQIDNFCERLAQVTGMPEAKADNWPKAFDALDAALAKNIKTIVFLDEISWMGGYDKSFAAFLKNAWDTQFSRHGKLIFAIAGSVSSWIQDNVLRSKAFVGRISLDITLPELPLPECLEFWGRKANRVAMREVLDILSVTGGVPKYLQEIDPSLPAEENIRRLCFLPEGYLFKEFEGIFRDTFGQDPVRLEVLTALSNGPASLSELAKALKMKANGHLSGVLRDLTLAGFISANAGKNPETGRAVREVQYRLRDNYVRFYLKIIEPRKTAIQDGLFRFVSLEQLPGWEAIMGLQFENLVLNNIKALCPLIGLEGKLITSAAPYSRRRSDDSAGVQVDLLIQTPKSVYLVEVKRREHITIEIEGEMEAKVAKMRLPKGISVRTVLVYDGSIAPEVEENGYFDYLVPIKQLFNMN